MKCDDLLHARPLSNLVPFLEQYQKVHGNIDIDKAREFIQLGKKYYENKATEDSPTSLQEELEQQWYSSIKDKTVMDASCYECYNHDYYFTDLWLCWVMYSRGYLRTIEKAQVIDSDCTVKEYLTNINTVVDLGCGIGYTTASLKQLFPQAKVYGTNLKTLSNMST